MSSTDSRSRSLSPSDESRFVPHSSVVGASSIMEHHYAASNQDGNALARRVYGEEEAGKEPNLFAVGLVGATICFTPEPSPRLSPNLEGVREDLSNICSLSVSSNYIGSVNAYTTGGGGVEGESSKMTSSAMHIASSLDGRSTTEYEILDGVSSRGTMDIEDLSLDEESPSITLPSLNCGGDHDDDFGLPIADKTESPLMMFKTLSVDEHHGETLILGDITAGRDGDSPVTSPKVDEHSLTPFNKILKLWEGRRTIGTETTQGVNSDESSTEMCTYPSDARVNETRSSGQQSLNLTKARTLMPFAKVKQALNFIAASMLSFVASASTLFVIFLCGFNAYVLGIVNRIVGQIRLRNVTRGTIAQDIIGAGPPQDEVNRVAMSTEDLQMTNLSKLFFLDALEEERIIGTLAESVRQFESEELEQSSVDNKVASLDQQEKAILKTINDVVTAGIVAKCKRVMTSMKFAASRFAIIASSSCICTMLICIYFTSCVHIFRKSTDISRVEDEDDNLLCVSTKMTSYVSIPLWEVILSPIFFEEGYVVYNEAPVEVGPKFWPSTMVIISITTSLLCALIFTSKIPFPTTKRKRVDNVLIGIWSEEEHRQFLEGYNMHGIRWKLVCAFVPTRTHAQVRTHGSYWLKIHSPKRMTKSRKQDHISVCPSSVSSSKSTPRKSNPIMVTPNGILRKKDQNRLHKLVTPKSEGRITKMRQMQGSKSDPAKRVEIDAH